MYQTVQTWATLRVRRTIKLNGEIQDSPDGRLGIVLGNLGIILPRLPSLDMLAIGSEVEITITRNSSRRLKAEWSYI